MAKENKPLMIFLAGTLYNEENLIKQINSKEYDFYGADGGILLAEKLGLSLKHTLGDFDSAPKPPLGEPLIYPSEKDQTDAELALDLAIREGYHEIWLIAPFGGRVDHTIANLFLLEKAQKNGVSLYLYDGFNLTFLMKKGTHQLNDRYRYYSFFAWKNEASLSLDGFKYPLNRYPLKAFDPIGISNEAIIEAPSAAIHEGSVLCICIEE